VKNKKAWIGKVWKYGRCCGSSCCNLWGRLAAKKPIA